MTGVVLLLLLATLAGYGALWGLRGWEHWTDAIRLAGLACLLGTAVLGIALAWLLSFEGSVSAWRVVALALGIAAAGTAAGVARRRPRPALRRREHPREPFLWLALACLSLIHISEPTRPY